ncbi:hypothetical protein EON83_25850 [bacterium]|nr:MAG: hypothetical protein EON83_25850 [bacterium]
MKLVVLCFVALYLVGVLVWLVRLSAQFGAIRREAACLREERDEYKNAWSRAIQKLSAAEQQLVDLRRETPGRDRSGRFIKRVTEVCGSE